MGLSITPTDDAVLTAVRSLLLAALPSGWEVIAGQANRVPEPQGLNFVVMTPARRTRLSTNTDTWDRSDAAPVSIDIAHDVEVGFQLDIHGPGGADAGSLISAVLRDAWGVDFLQSTGVTPLYATDGRQVPFLNAENQYEDRWVIEAAFQIVPTVSTPAEFAATLDTTVYPPIEGQ